MPSLGGQPAFYLTVQLFMFRERLRVVEPMTQLTKGVSDADLQAMADAIAKLPPPRPRGGTAAGTEAGAVDAERMERARAVIAQNRCNFCHNPDFSGERNVPRLAGQREDYLASAMLAYRNNTRRGYDASMADVLYGVTDEQIRDLAYFLARR